VPFVLATLAVPATASAHAILLRTIPANGAQVPAAPHAVVVEFDDTIQVGPGNAAIANATRASVTEGPATAHGRTLTIPLRHGLGAGDYSIRWSVVSEDGHREEGVLAFAVGAGSARPAALLTTSVPLGKTTMAFRLLFYAGLLVAAGVSFFALLHRLGEAARAPLARLLFFALLAAFVGVGVVVRSSPGGTRNALVLQVALGVAVVGAACAALAPRVPRLLALAEACALALVVAPTLSGHALDPNQPQLLAVPADLAHTASAAVWLGGLAALLWLVPRAGLDAARRGAVVRRFSSTALVAVAVLAVSGLLRALTELRVVDQVWTTSYGRTLIVKSALFVLLVALGWVNRSRLLPDLGRLRRTVRAEVVLLLGVLAAVAILVQLRPGTDAPAAAAAVATRIQTVRPPRFPPPGASVDARELGSLAVAVARRPGLATITLVGPDGTGRSGQAVTVDGLRARPCGAGCYDSRAAAGPLRVKVDGRSLIFSISPAAPGAAALLARVTRAYEASHSIVFEESLSSGLGAHEQTRFELRAPDDLIYDIRGGPQAVVMGARRWDRTSPNGRWIESDQTPIDVMLPYWSRPADVRLIAPGTLTFFDRTIPAWFELTLGSSDLPARLRMTAAAHFMVDRYLGYGVPVAVSPPSR